MNNVLHGLQKFRKEVFPAHRELFAGLATGQSPEVLFITCADSRIDPNLLTQTKPGELFIIRNAGNMIPAFGSAIGGVTASIEYAVVVLNVKEIVVCGHSDCGAMKGVLHPEKVASMKTVAGWLAHGESARAVVNATHGKESESVQLERLIEENVLTQLRNLVTHPSVAARLATKSIRLHGWVYNIGHGTVSAYDQTKGRFVELDEAQDSETLATLSFTGGGA